MKKLYRKGTVHPSPPIISDHLSFLPAAILTLASALSLEDKEVLAYLISCNSAPSGTTKSNYRNKPQKGSSGSSFFGTNDHRPCFGCDCFRCYKSYWVRWGTSPNRQLIHEIIDAYEDSLVAKGRGNGKSKRERKRASNKSSTNNSNSSVASIEHQTQLKSETDQSAEVSNGAGGDEEEKGSVRRIVGFIGERIWGALNLG